jgi:hypothetical protein
VWKNAQDALAAVLSRETLDLIAAATVKRTRAMGMSAGQAAAAAPVAG